MGGMNKYFLLFTVFWFQHTTTSTQTTCDSRTSIQTSCDSRTSIQTSRHNTQGLRIMMVGKTGVGKSATGNTILGKKIFKSKFSSQSLTKVCQKAFAEVNGEKVSVIDSPGLFDTKTDEERTSKEIGRCIYYASPGPHVFLIIIQLGRFTDEEKKTVLKIQKLFGEEADRYSMVLFTHGDLLELSIEEFVEDNEDLKDLMAKCNGNYHVFNNKAEDQSQVSELLDKIRFMVWQNGGSHYTTAMFQMAEKAIEEETQRILKEKEEQMRKEEEELKKKLREKFKQQMIELKDNPNPYNLWNNHHIQTKEELEKLKWLQIFLATEDAEKSVPLMEQLLEYIKKGIRYIFG